MSATTASPSTDERLQFDIADRVRRSLRVADVSVQEMADYLEVSRNTVGSWINGRYRPRRRDLRLIAMRTGFPLAWLETGELPDLDSNQEPAGNKPGLVLDLVSRLRRNAAAELGTPA